ncbi:hypothetical protein ACFLYU_03505 [Candidatus Dependentiae bacterium]
MKVKCIANTGGSLSQKTIDAGYKKDSQLNVKIGSKYTVYSMIMRGDSLDYLIVGESLEAPSWYPAELFEVTNHLLPMTWLFTFDKYKNYKGEDSQIAIWGYKEMISDPEHYIALTEGKQKALEVFIKRKQEIDECEELRWFQTKK